MTMPSASPRILLLDDDGFVLRLLTRMLAQLGHTNVIAFEDGLKALQELRAEQVPIDLIVLDLNMPGMDGIEFIRQLADYRYAGSVALASGENSRILESVNRLLQLNNISTLGHLRKPVQAQDLKTLLERLAPGDGSRGRPAATSS
jgi:CheY-like chemotaxis protein